MDTVQKYWMGIGIFDRLYSERKLQKYISQLNTMRGQKLFILADEITGTNNLVLSGKSWDIAENTSRLQKYRDKAHARFAAKEMALRRMFALSDHPEEWDVRYWDVCSADPDYNNLLMQLRESIARFENHYLKKEVLKVTIFGFGARLRKNFTSSFVDFVFEKDFYRYLETLSEYTLAELAAIFLFARRGWIKAGHAEERPYDDLALMFYDRLGTDFLVDHAPKFLYI
jgi:hypothetical protein